MKSSEDTNDSFLLKIFSGIPLEITKFLLSCVVSQAGKCTQKPLSKSRQVYEY